MPVQSVAYSDQIGRYSTPSSERIRLFIEGYLARMPGPLSGKQMMDAYISSLGVDTRIRIPGDISLRQAMEELVVYYGGAFDLVRKAHLDLHKYRETYLRFNEEFLGLDIVFPNPMLHDPEFQRWDFYNFRSILVRAFRRHFGVAITNVFEAETQIKALRQVGCVALRIICLLADQAAVHTQQPHILRQLQILREYVTHPDYPPGFEELMHMNPADVTAGLEI